MLVVFSTGTRKAASQGFYDVIATGTVVRTVGRVSTRQIQNSSARFLENQPRLITFGRTSSEFATVSLAVLATDQVSQRLLRRLELGRLDFSVVFTLAKSV